MLCIASELSDLDLSYTPPLGSPGRGCYVKPTLLSHADNTMRIARGEIFGPILTVITYRNKLRSISIAGAGPGLPPN